MAVSREETRLAGGSRYLPTPPQSQGRFYGDISSVHVREVSGFPWKHCHKPAPGGGSDHAEAVPEPDPFAGRWRDCSNT
jgi:hypothetical protein